MPINLWYLDSWPSDHLLVGLLSLRDGWRESDQVLWGKQTDWHRVESSPAVKSFNRYHDKKKSLDCAEKGGNLWRYSTFHLCFSSMAKKACSVLLSWWTYAHHHFPYLISSDFSKMEQLGGPHLLSLPSFRHDNCCWSNCKAVLRATDHLVVWVKLLVMWEVWSATFCFFNFPSQNPHMRPFFICGLCQSLDIWVGLRSRFLQALWECWELTQFFQMWTSWGRYPFQVLTSGSKIHPTLLPSPWVTVFRHLCFQEMTSCLKISLSRWDSDSRKWNFGSKLKSKHFGLGNKDLTILIKLQIFDLPTNESLVRASNGLRPWLRRVLIQMLTSKPLLHSPDIVVSQWLPDNRAVLSSCFRKPRIQNFRHENFCVAPTFFTWANELGHGTNMFVEPLSFLNTVLINACWNGCCQWLLLGADQWSVWPTKQSVKWTFCLPNTLCCFTVDRRGVFCGDAHFSECWTHNIEWLHTCENTLDGTRKKDSSCAVSKPKKAAGNQNVGHPRAATLVSSVSVLHMRFPMPFS